MRAFLAVALLCLTAATADARPRRHHHHHTVAHHADRPSACRGIPWCGCWLRLRHGISDASLNAARQWARVGRPAFGPGRGVIAVWAHHVGEITENLGGGMVRMISGNDGNRVRDRVRSLRGVIALRQL